MSKKCIKCNEEKPLTEFYKGSCLYGKDSRCKVCSDEYRKNYTRTFRGLIGKIYSSQKHNSKFRKYDPPNYSLKELLEWVNKNLEAFNAVYFLWVNSGYKKELTPSIDRINDYLPYTLTNIQILSWGANELKGHLDIKQGVNNKISKAVIQLSLENEVINIFHSQSEAARQLSINQGKISLCCLGKRNSAGGYRWKYVE